MGMAVGSALIAAGSVTPIILTIDKAVVQAAAGQVGLLSALRMGTMDFLLRPHKVIFSVPMFLVVGVYGATYIAANLLDVYHERKGILGQQAAMSKLFGTTAVNMSASLVKDIAFAKMFGKQVEKAAAETKPKVPAATYLIFLSRDMLTIAGGFTVPPLMSNMYQQTANMSKQTADKVA